MTIQSFARHCLGSAFLFAVSAVAPAQATVYTWTGTTSTDVSDATNWGGTGPASGDNIAAAAPDWQLPDTLAAGANYGLNLPTGSGAWYVGGSSGGGITFLGGGATPTPYTITGGDASNVLNIAGITNYTSTTLKGLVTNNSTAKQLFDVDINAWQTAFDAKNGDIEIKAGRTLTSGGGTTAISSNAIRNQHITEFKGDKTIYMNATALANTSSTTNRGALVYLGADTTPTASTALVLGNIGTGFMAKVLITSANGGVVRAIHNDSLGFTDTLTGGFAALVGTEIGLRGGFSNGTLEIDGTAGNLTINEFFRVGVRTEANGAAHIRNVAGNNTLTGAISLNFASDPNGNSMFFESAAGKITFAGTIVQDRPAASITGGSGTAYFRGAGAIDIGGTLNLDGVATGPLNVDKNGTGTMTTLAGTVVNYAGPTAIHAGSYILNGTHSNSGAGAYTVDATGTLGGKGSTAAPVTLAGKLTPGDVTGVVSNVGTFTIGGLTLSGGTLDFQLDADDHTVGSANDLVISTGAIDLTGGATLNVSPIGGNLTAGDYDLIQFTGGITGVGTNITLGTIPVGAGLSPSIIVDSDSVNLHIAAGLPGDYNHDGKVNAADYVLWRKDPTNNGGPGGYATWRANFGNPPGSGSGLEGAGSVPEPGCTLVILFTVTIACIRQQRRWGERTKPFAG